LKLSRLTTERLAAVVCDALERHGFTAVLTGGACVMIYAEGKYVSKDMDFVLAPQDRLGEVEAAFGGLGFRAAGRVYVHPDVDMAVDVGNRWPLAVGQEILKPPPSRLVSGYRLRMLSATDCVKDRLAAFYYWEDRQAFEQAILVCLAQRVNMREVGRWSRAEGQELGFSEFQRELNRRRHAARRSV
jgi:hypothetical protein